MSDATQPRTDLSPSNGGAKPSPLNSTTSWGRLNDVVMHAEWEYYTDPDHFHSSMKLVEGFWGCNILGEEVYIRHDASERLILYLRKLLSGEDGRPMKDLYFRNDLWEWLDDEEKAKIRGLGAGIIYVNARSLEASTTRERRLHLLSSIRM